MAVLARVCASTVLTITAQARLGPGKPLPDGSPGPSLACAVIVKTVDAQTRAKTAINDLLRD